MPKAVRQRIIPAEAATALQPAIFEDLRRAEPSVPAPTAADTTAVQEVPMLPELPPAAEPQEEAAPSVSEDWSLELQRAYEQGFEDGKTAAAALYEAEFRRHRQWLQRFDQVVAQLQQQAVQLQEQVMSAALRLAFIVAEHILRGELRRNPEQLAALVSSALAAIPEQVGGLQLRLHPDTIAVLEQVGSQVLQNPEVRIVVDPAVEPEGCIVESRWGIVDARLSEQLRAIWEQLQ